MSRQPLPLGQWAEPGITLAARINAIKAEAIARDIPTFRMNWPGIACASFFGLVAWAGIITFWSL